MPDANVNNTNTNTPTEQPAAPETVEEQQTFSLDYVKALRTENKNHRLAAKNYETALKGILGVDDLTDLEKKIKSFNDKNTEALSAATKAANDRLIKAELKAKTADYDEKLLMRLIDMSKITVDDKGDVTGIDEAIKAVEDEFPQVKNGKTTPKPAPGTGTNNAGGGLSGVEAAFLARNPGLKI